MKKILALILALTMLVGVLASCNNNPDNTDNSSSSSSSSESSSSSSSESSSSSSNNDDVIVPTNLSGKLTASFKELVKNNPDMSGEEIAEALVEGEYLAGRDFGTMGFLYEADMFEFMVGFSDFNPSEFKKATFIGPMISSTPFAAYVFELDENADAAAFASYLSKHANPGWNVCVIADQVMCDYQDNMVFIVMCTEMEVISVDYNEKLVNRFVDYMYGSNDGSAESIAAHLCEMEDFPLGLISEAVSANDDGSYWLSGLGNFSDFVQAAKFAPMIGSIPFVGYIFVIDQATDASAFIKTLKDNANTRWNVCTEADLIITEAYNDSQRNVVLFMMCPENYDN